MDVHTADARKGDERDRRLATISAWQLVVVRNGWKRFFIAFRKMPA